MSHIKCNRCGHIFNTDNIKENELDSTLKKHYDEHQFDDMLKTNYTLLPDKV